MAKQFTPLFPRLYFMLFIRKILGIRGSSICRHCGRKFYDFSVTDEVWNTVDQYIKFGHLLCYDCFCKYCRKIGLPAIWQLQKIESDGQ